MASAFYLVSSMVRGYHECMNVWDATVGEILPCNNEYGNFHDPYDVSVKKDAIIVAHVPKNILCICSLFLRRGGSIDCEVTGSRQYSADLAQGGLEIPCKLIFVKEVKEVQKVQRLLKPVITAPTTPDSSSSKNKNVVSQNVVKVFQSLKTTITMKDSLAVAVKVNSSFTSVSIVESLATSVTVLQSSSIEIKPNLQDSSEPGDVMNYLCVANLTCEHIILES